jgi:hypothetical protein
MAGQGPPYVNATGLVSEVMCEVCVAAQGEELIAASPATLVLTKGDVPGTSPL